MAIGGSAKVGMAAVAIMATRGMVVAGVALAEAMGMAITATKTGYAPVGHGTKNRVATPGSFAFSGARV